MNYLMSKNELQQNQASLSALETVERLLRGLSYDGSEPDPRLKGIDAPIAEAVQLVNGIKRRVMGAVDADVRQFEQRKPELEGLIKRCTARLFENEQAIQREKQQLKNRLHRDEKQIEQMKAIGMSSAKIAKVYTVISPEEIAAVDVECARLQDEIDKLYAFTSDYPRYDLALLDGIEV